MPDKPLLSQAFVRVILTLIGAVHVASIFHFAHLIFPRSTNAMVDFDSFHLAGRMVWDGTIDQAYQATRFYKRQQELGQNLFMPWTYPPPFNLIVAPLALLPLPIAYAIFIGPMLIAYVLTLHRLAGRFLPFVLAATSPALIINIRCGQNGLLTSTLLGLVAIGMLRAKPWSGVPLGLMILKPHLAITLSCAILLQQRWRIIAVAALTSALVVALSTWLLGPQIWMAFLNATREAKIFLTEGYYPLFRMVSVYAGVRSLGMPASIAASVQFAVAMVMMGIVTWVAFKPHPLRTKLGLAVLTATFITPYAYDYDLCLLGIAFALLGPAIAHALSEREQFAVLLLSLCGTAAGFLQNIRAQRLEDDGTVVVVGEHPFVSFGAWPLLVIVGFIVFKLLKTQQLMEPARA